MWAACHTKNVVVCQGHFAVVAGAWAVIGKLLGWAMLLVMGLDAYENTRMPWLLEQEITEAAARSVTLVARTKFLIIGAAGLWLLLTCGSTRGRR